PPEGAAGADGHRRSQARADHRSGPGRGQRLHHQAVHRADPAGEARQDLRAPGGDRLMAVAIDKAWLVQRLQEALVALESGDEAGWRREIDALAAARTQPMMAGLSRLARELGQALGELPTLPSEA